jgi:DNA-binding cell septation regulator SpoVG
VQQRKEKIMKTVSEVQIHVIKPKNGLVGFASLVFDGCLYLGSIGVHRKLDGSGFRITYPNKVVGNETLDLFYPINREVGYEIEKAITDKATELLGS